MKHCSGYTISEFNTLENLDLDQKLEVTLEILEEFNILTKGKFYISFSGGKDSTVLSHLVEQSFPDKPNVFCDTGLEYPEVKEFALSKQNVIVLKPKKSFKYVLDTYGYPVISKEQSRYINDVQQDTLLGIFRKLGGTYSISQKYLYLCEAPFKISDRCCYHLKKSPMYTYERKTKEYPVIGVMARDSNLRMKYIINKGCNRLGKRLISNPLGFWNEQNILEYLYKNKLKYSSIYGEITKINGVYSLSGVKHTGCMFCMFGLQHEEQPNKFQRMKITHPKQYNLCMDTLGLNEVLNYLNIPH